MEKGQEYQLNSHIAQWWGFTRKTPYHIGVHCISRWQHAVRAAPSSGACA